MGEAMKSITFNLDDHDHDQVVLLAAINRVTLSKMVRQICQDYLDGRWPKRGKELQENCNADR
jgi:hypothetical protein